MRQQVFWQLLKDENLFLTRTPTRVALSRPLNGERGGVSLQPHPTHFYFSKLLSGCQEQLFSSYDNCLEFIMMDKDTKIFWQQALGQLQLQMTQATFDTWFANTAAQLENGVLTIYTPNAYAKDWLESRLFSTISRTVNNLAGQSLELHFVVKNATGNTPEAHPGPGEIAISLVSFDPMQRGYLVTPHYIIRFWQPYLSQDPFSLWFSLRSFGYQAEKNAWPSIQTLADICFNGNRHRILGRAASGRSKDKIGALEILENERVVWVKREGEGRMTRYTFRVLESLPLLTPTQVAKLSPRLQEAHTRFIKQSEIDLKEWGNLTLPSLLE